MVRDYGGHIGKRNEMAYINTGANGPIGEKDIASKKRLKDLLESNPGDVYFYGTSELGPTFSGLFGNQLTANLGNDTLTVVGPNPYTNRKWYASITVKNGKVIVK